MADRKHILQETKLGLFAEAAGHCQHPDCLQPLFPAEMGGDKHIAEMAHVIPHGEKGPRHEERPDGEFEADSFENLMIRERLRFHLRNELLRLMEKGRVSPSQQDTLIAADLGI